MKASASGLGGVAEVCSLSTLLSNFTPHVGADKGIVTTIDGQRAIKITDKTRTGYAYVSDTATPELLRIYKPGTDGGQLDFSYGSATTITPPPAGQVVDASQAGL